MNKQELKYESTIAELIKEIDRISEEKDELERKFKKYFLEIKEDEYKLNTNTI
jgi:hypothetical protein